MLVGRDLGVCEIMKFKGVVCSFAALALAAAPLSSASAHPWHYHGGILFGIGALGAAVVGTAAAVATAPLVALAPRPVYPAPGYYAAPAYYAPPPAYYAPPPAYYAAPPAYYAPGYYGR